MISYGIGYGQIEDFKIFLKGNGCDSWDDLDDGKKLYFARLFVAPSTNHESDDPTPNNVSEKVVEAKKQKKPDIMSFYRDTISKAFTPETLAETSMSKAFLVAMNRNGWVLEIILKDNSKTTFPFISEENMHIIVNKIWSDFNKYAKDNNLI